MAYWLMKSEPSVYSIDDLERDGSTDWTGVRNYQVRNMMRDDMRRGDHGLFYHSSCEVPGVYGTVEIVREGYPDPSAFDPRHRHHDAASDPEAPRWYAVDVKLTRRFAQPVTLEALRLHAGDALKDLLVLRRGNRLSITPLSAAQYRFILSMAG